MELQVILAQNASKRKELHETAIQNMQRYRQEQQQIESKKVKEQLEYYEELRKSQLQNTRQYPILSSIRIISVDIGKRQNLEMLLLRKNPYHPTRQPCCNG